MFIHSWFDSCYEAEEVLFAVGITALVAFSLTLFAFQTKIDFTMCSGGLLVLLVCLLIFGIFAIIFPNKVGQCEWQVLVQLQLCLPPRYCDWMW